MAHLACLTYHPAGTGLEAKCLCVVALRLVFKNGGSRYLAITASGDEGQAPKLAEFLDKVIKGLRNEMRLHKLQWTFRTTR